MSRDLRKWIEGGAHLPRVLRDFHDQKEVFKSIDQWAPKRIPMILLVDAETGEEGSLDWITAHCYTIDHFLRFMAGHGYTLQRSRARLTFCSLDRTIADRRAHDAEVFRAELAKARAAS